MIKNIETERLFLRPYDLTDASMVQKLADDKAIAETTFVPYPYTIEKVKEWINRHAEMIQNGDAYPFAVLLKNENQLIGAMTIRVDQVHHKGELAYWVGKDYWGKGFATEMSKAVLAFGFHELNLHRIWAPVMKKNIASGKVMEKIGLSYEGTLKEDILKWGSYEDVHIYGLLRKDYC